MNHGHVTPNPDGSRARCGGPGLCQTCSAEKAAQVMRAEIEAKQKASGVDTSPARTDFLIQRISELVTEHGPRYLTAGMGRNEAHEAILECIEALVHEVAQWREVPKAIEKLSGEPLNQANPPLAVTASWTLLHLKIEDMEKKYAEKTGQTWGDRP